MNTKSNQKAETIRIKGCQALKNGELYEALLKFNKSLCLAEPFTETSAQILANRAEVYFNLKLFEKCLNNVQLSREQCSQVKIEYLDELEEKCLNQTGDALDENENPWEFFKLTYPANKKLPNVIESLEVKCDKKFGRYIMTNQPLNVGDIIAIEKPFFKILKVDPHDDEYPESNMYQYCANCLKDNLMDLIPCNECVVTMFCSPNCRREANKGFHQYECNILQLLNETGNWRMPLRCFFDALAICSGYIEELERVMEVCENSSPTVFNFDFSNLKSFKDKQYHLLCMLSLTNNVSVNIHDFSHLFQHHPRLEELWSSHRSFIEKFLQRMMQVEILNFHGIKGRSLNRNKPYRACLGDGGFPFCSLINHSCCPNVMRIVVENRMVVVVERPIKKGEQLFDCYIGDSFYFKPTHSRREELLDYQFMCECDACENNFPGIMSSELEGIDKALLSMAQKAYDDLRDPRKPLKPEAAKELAVKYSRLMQKNYSEKNYPCREIVLLQLCIIKCFLVACKSTINFP